MLNTCDRIRKKCEELADFLCDKNKKYGDSALRPVSIFAKGDAMALIHSRIDDKLSRIKVQSDDEDEDLVLDLAGYLILLLLAEEDFGNRTC